MKFEEYLQALQTEEQPNYHEFYAIRSKFNVLQTMKHTKKGLYPFDDKPYVLSGGINTLAHGHFKIKQLRQATKLILVGRKETFHHQLKYVLKPIVEM